MPISIADQFRGLPMGDLIGAPLIAAADAQVRLANATANFIQQVGFLPPANANDPTSVTTFDPNTFGIVLQAHRRRSTATVQQGLSKPNLLSWMCPCWQL
jgi:hypothetical protein